MTLQQLQYVIALDTYRHFVTAAEKCFVTQPTITIQVKKLEEEIGFLIFDKSKFPLKPTDLGKVFILKAKTILDEVSELKNMVNVELDNLEGEFKIAVIPTISSYLIPLISGSFSEKYPKTILKIQELESDQIILALQKKEIDIGILVTPLNEAFIREIKLYNEPFVFYGQSDYFDDEKKSIDIDELEKLENVWLLEKGHCFRNQVLNICGKQENSNTIQFQSGSIEALKKMVDNYGGYTLVPEMAINANDTGRIIHFSEPKPIREVSLVTHQTFSKEVLLNALRLEIIEKTPSEFVKNERFIKVNWR
ncbi:LysR family transcriptional regulator, hydrogen peroxide-inducible genes activator [Mesonia phycicola]|uniref:LysR family transcriptional regulator, hydrogen peroxide-inducible genes activator n=1 Tax=Mesonia phycicola TaxID=579105 RepID=A0A1M6A389_9FLAO|nr:hydrogen peroxide-inducible genes activator [Mesonia phycicola]SHI30935.1 LysR family transcriptional regulator, hydrogen peroxide-inducible genes activator [Mesonia phycicola]